VKKDRRNVLHAMKYLKCFENVVEPYQCNLDYKTNIKVSSPILQMLFFKFTNNNLPRYCKNQQQKVFVVVELHSYSLHHPQHHQIHEYLYVHVRTLYKREPDFRFTTKYRTRMCVITRVTTI